MTAEAEDRGIVRIERAIPAPPPGLVQTLIAHDLIDEMRLMIDPIVLGGGKRLFAADGSPRRLRLSSNQVTTTGALLLTYTRAQPTPGSRRLT